MVGRFERFSYAISEISKYWHKLAAEEMAPYGLRAAHSVYLLALAREPGGMTASQLCEACGKDKGDVSRRMAILEKKALVRKEGGFHNGYGGLFRLTPEGLAAAEHVKARAGLAVCLAGSGLTEESRTVLYEALDSIVERLQALSKEGLPET